MPTQEELAEDLSRWLTSWHDDLESLATLSPDARALRITMLLGSIRSLWLDVRLPGDLEAQRSVWSLVRGRDAR